jgi:hypothetical protein
MLTKAVTVVSVVTEMIQRFEPCNHSNYCNYYSYIGGSRAHISVGPPLLLVTGGNWLHRMEVVMANRILNVSILWTLIWLGWSFVTKDPWWPSEIMNWTTAERGFFLVEVGLLTIGAAVAPFGRP